jgi:hypothetical protein
MTSHDQFNHPERWRGPIVADKTFAIASEVDGNSDWFGTVEPLSPPRALDKLTWWAGGGDAGTAAEVRDPWRAIRELNLRRQ